MCRSKSHGGRRCAVHDTPEKRAARNARRRALYAQRKQEQALTSQDQRVSSSFFRQEYQGASGETLYTNLPETVEDNEALNIQVSRNKGVLTHKGYFADRTVRGTIDFSQLDSESYKAFGFSPMPTDGKMYVRDSFLEQEEVEQLSSLELADTTPDERKALQLFSSESYEWINRNLYEEGTEISPTREDEREQIADYYSGEFIPGYQDTMLREDMKTAEFLNATTSLLDSALEKAPGAQRIVYRGVSADSSIFDGYANGAEGWLDDNAQLGQELVFDGYQSSTLDPTRAQSYMTADDSIMYEILTPEGASIESNSLYSFEQEVLLPRKSRYMVVGVHRNVNTETNWGEQLKINVVQLVAINDKGEVLDGTNND